MAVAGILKTSKNDTIVPLGIATKPAADVSPVEPNDTQAEPGSELAHPALGAIAIVAAIEFDCPESAAVPTLANNMIESAFVDRTVERERKRKTAKPAVRLPVIRAPKESLTTQRSLDAPEEKDCLERHMVQNFKYNEPQCDRRAQSKQTVQWRGGIVGTFQKNANLSLTG